MSSLSADPSATGSLDGLAAVYAHRIAAALPLNWAQRISMHDARGQVCWQSAGVWGPTDLDAVRLALERFVGNSAPARADHELPEQRTAVLLRAATPPMCFAGSSCWSWTIAVCAVRESRSTICPCRCNAQRTSGP